MDPRTGLYGGKSRTQRYSIPGPSSPYSVAIPTELPGPFIFEQNYTKLHFAFVHEIYLLFFFVCLFAAICISYTDYQLLKKRFCLCIYFTHKVQ